MSRSSGQDGVSPVPVPEPVHANDAVLREPVSDAERIVAIDTLRGVAILGILVMNIYAFAMPFAAYSNPVLMGGLEAHNMGTWFVTHVLFDQKFLSIFAMLFGAGLILMYERARKKGVNFLGIYFRRQFWLAVFGLIHGYLIWFGDILFHYALMGVLVFFLRKLPAKRLIVIALCMLPVGNVITFVFASNIESLRAEVLQIQDLQQNGESVSQEQRDLMKKWDDLKPMVAPDREDLQKDLEAYRGNYLEIIAYRAPLYTLMVATGTFSFVLWRVLPLMLIGMALMKLDVLTGRRRRVFYRNMMIAGYVAGLPLTLYSAVDLSAHGFDALYAFRTGLIPNYYGSIFVALGHIGAIMLVIRSGICGGIVQRFAATGRMALTNYLMQSLVMTTVFYGYGFGLYGEIPRLMQMGFVAGLIVLQLLASKWWLARFHFGPVEWLWRALSYRDRPAMRRQHAPK